MRSRFDVVVVGNGILGMTCARELQRRDSRISVAVVGPREAPAGASRAAGAMLGCVGEVTRYTLASSAGREKFELSLEAHGLWPEFLAELQDEAGGEHVDSVVGTHVILNGRSGFLDSENFVSLRAVVDAYGVRSEVDVEIPGLRPSPDSRPLRSVFLPDEGAVDALGVLRCLSESNRRAGVESLDAQVVAIESSGESVEGVRLSTGTVIPTNAVLVAAGAFSTPLLNSVLPPASVQPVFAGSGVALLTRRVLGEGFNSVVRSVNRAGSCGLHVIPFEGATEYLGATNVIFREPETLPHVGIVHFLAESAIDQLDTNISYSRILSTRIGNRPVPLDTFPLLGPTAVDGLSLVTGTFRDGFHASPLLARMAATEVLGGDGPRFPEVFHPMRRPIENWTQQESIEDFAFEAVSGAYENGMRLSRFMDHEDLAEMFRARALAFYESTGTGVGLAPDVLNFLMQSRKDPTDVDHVVEYLSAVERG